MATRHQHYVWRHYLEGWHAHDMLVTSLVGDKLVRTKPRNIMVERDFYRLRAITPADAAVLRFLLMSKETPSGACSLSILGLGRRGGTPVLSAVEIAARVSLRETVE